METVEIRPKFSLPITIQLRRSPRLDELAQRIATHEAAMREREKQVQSLTVAAQRLEGATYSLETARQKAEIKRQLMVAERQLLEQKTYRDRTQNERSQWLEQIATKEYTRRRLLEELAGARPGPVSDWSMTRMYAIGQPVQRTTGDVRRDLVDTLTWLLNFAGPDAELRDELQQLQEAWHE